jgi:hypothetical protein
VEDDGIAVEVDFLRELGQSLEMLGLEFLGERVPVEHRHQRLARHGTSLWSAGHGRQVAPVYCAHSPVFCANAKFAQAPVLQAAAAGGGGR